MSERILIPLDGSKSGEAALHYVEGMFSRLAPGKKVEVILFHAVTALRHDVKISRGGAGTITVPYNESELEQMKADAMKYLEEVGENLRNKGATVSSKVSIGQKSAEEIIKAEEEFNADLVAMSTHGRAGVSRWALGSVTDKVLRGGKVPVLMVRAGA
ncbi:MAG: universal stress protein [Dehalococcoidia bacterium]|nr:MAG: universal stress protein [Dehalococcoidia bacterium]